MKPKTGNCSDCPPGSGPKALIAGRCETHYWAYRRKVNAERFSNKKKVELVKPRDLFFANQILIAPKTCENCGNDLGYTKAINPRAMIAHILPKRDKEKGGCPSVQFHPMNRWFGCIDCHTNFDNMGEAYVLKMPVLIIIRERFDQFKDQVAEDERANIPNYLLSNVESDYYKGAKANWEKWKENAIRMEKWFEGRNLPAPPIKMNEACTITNVKLYVDTQIKTIRANQEKPWQAAFKPAYMRLYYLKKFIENAQAGTADGVA